MRHGLPGLLLCEACGGGSSTGVSSLPAAPPRFANGKNLSVHPLALTPDARLDVLDVSGGGLGPADPTSHP